MDGRPGTAGRGGPGEVISIKAIDHVVFRARNMEAMVRFYEDVLGARIERQVEELGLVQLRAGGCLIDLVDCAGRLGQRGGAPPGVEGRNIEHVCFRLDPWNGEAILAFLATHGIPEAEIAQRYGAEGYGPSIYLADPEGNVLELKGPFRELDS